MKILVVEDEVKIANAIKKGLEMDGHVVETSQTGNEALDFATEESFEMILLDLMIPELSGEEVCKNLREKGVNTPIIMLTAKDNEQSIVKGLDLGADDYITKPFSLNELKARIKAVSRRPRKDLDLVIKLKNAEINTSKQEVFKNKRQVMLSKKEYLVLEYLAKNKGRTITKDQLIEHVWGYESDAIANNVEVYINHLRKKLDKNIIKTVRGYGYKIE
jgi:DNA-binding response OmpR family regulator